MRSLFHQVSGQGSPGGSPPVSGESCCFPAPSTSGGPADSSPLVFVFLGAAFPDYGLHSLAIASRTTSNRLVVLADSPRPPQVNPEIEWLQISHFYEGNQFEGFVLNSAYSPEFRDGFWLKTAERFMVLHAYMKHAQIQSLYHGELDCLFFALPELETELRASQKVGVFLPREIPSRCIASLVYINDESTLKDLCEFLVSNSALGNEMDILGALEHSNASKFFALPTVDSLFRGTTAAAPDTWPVHPIESSFVVDGAAIGRWIFGVDPRNTRGRGTKNRIQTSAFGAPFTLPLSMLRISLEEFGGWNIRVEGPNGRPRRVAALHVHSKVHAKITPIYLGRLLARLQKGRPTRIVPSERNYPGEIYRRVQREIRLAMSSRLKTKAALKNMASYGWWLTFARNILNP